jgi:phosphoribosylanthranilate isomerase
MKPEELYFAESYFPFDQYVLDSYNPDTVGGTGELCDWEKSAQLVKAIKQPILLAGGLSPDNVVEALKTVAPAGVDVSSGVEMEPGKKDIAKVEAFLRAVRGC